jgi:hypothetical protein
MLWVRILLRARCTALCDKVCQWLVADLWFSPGPPVSSTNKTDCHGITEILLKGASNTIKPTIYNCLNGWRFHLLRWLCMWFYLLQCWVFINSSSSTPVNWSMYFSSWSTTLPLYTPPWIGGRALPLLTPLTLGMLKQNRPVRNERQQI